MTSRAEAEVIRLLGELALSDDPTQQLQDLKDTLFVMSSSGIQSVFRNLDLNALFDSFNTSDEWVGHVRVFSTWALLDNLNLL